MDPESHKFSFIIFTTEKRKIVIIFTLLEKTMLTTIIFKIETENINCFIKDNRARTMLKIWKMDICIESIEVLHENLKGCWGITIRRKLDNVAGSNIKSNVTALPKKSKMKVPNLNTKLTKYCLSGPYFEDKALELIDFYKKHSCKIATK